MEQISLQGIQVQNNRIEYRYTVTDGLKSYFCLDIPYFIEYTVDGAPLDLQNVPPSVLAVPFVCNVLPIIWLTDSELIVPELDKDFYESIPEFKQGYIDMHEDASFRGVLSIGTVIKNFSPKSGRSATFFSGGLDSWCTLIRHISEKPDLITLWGADFAYDNIDGWTIFYHTLLESLRGFSLPVIVIHSSFRKIVNEANLDISFFPLLHDGWWHGVQHGIGLIGHAAPCNFIRGVTTQYIAASFFPECGKVSSASWPTIDNKVRYFGCHTVHDAFISRIEKTAIVVRYCNDHNIRIPLHVCWENQNGKNCCHCEKCYRTMMGLWIEGADPQKYGFSFTPRTFSNLKQLITTIYDPNLPNHIDWPMLKQEEKKNISMLRTKPYYNDIKWIETFDFDHPERYWKRRLKRAAGYPRIFARKVKGKLKHVLGK